MIFVKLKGPWKEGCLMMNESYEITRPLIIKIRLKSIRKLHTRKFLHQLVGIEFQDKNLYTYTFVFQNEVALKKILSLLKENIQNHSIFDVQTIEKTDFTEEWQRHQISNFTYLDKINKFSSRSHEDLSQFPVFPWCIMNCKPNEIE